MAFKLHPSLANTTDSAKVVLGTGDVFTTVQEFEQRFELLRKVCADAGLLARIAKHMERVVHTPTEDGLYNWHLLRTMICERNAFHQTLIAFKSRENGGRGNFVANPKVADSEWFICPLSDALTAESEQFVLVVRQAPVPTPAGFVQQIKCEIYPQRNDRDYYLGNAIASVRLDESGALELGPCGPWSQHGVVDKAAGDLAMKAFHFPAKW